MLTYYKMDVQITWKCTGEMVRRSTLPDLCLMSTNMDTEAVPNEILKDCNMATELVTNEIE
jgi:hypothetical protein